MNKITPHLIRDLDATLPTGTECYLCSAVRNALFRYRKRPEPAHFLPKEQALRVLASQLGRGLNRFLRPEIRNELSQL